MPRTQEVALHCQIKAGGFSGERIAEVALAGGSTHTVLAPRHYCWTQDKRPLGLDEPAPGQTMNGLVAARRLGGRPGEPVVVTTPDGDVFEVPPEIVETRPAESEISPHVPV